MSSDDNGVWIKRFEDIKGGDVIDDDDYLGPDEDGRVDSVRDCPCRSNACKSVIVTMKSGSEIWYPSWLNVPVRVESYVF
jgi:hypothetical protein